MNKDCNDYCYENSENPDYNHVNNKIESVCCDPGSLIREQFTLRTTATMAVKTVYIANPGAAFVRGTVILRNLSNRATINFVVDGSNIVVGPNDEAAITVAALNVVSVQIISGAQTARVELFFDIQFPST